MNHRITLAALAFAPCVGLAACEAPEHRQFDFWLGEWNVFGPRGRQAGTNVITRGYGGCVIHERYTTPGAYAGESLSAYDEGRKGWHQTWVDNGGMLLRLDGRFEAGRMRLEGQTTDKDGKATKHRVTWTPQADGTVRQHWEQSVTEGEWTTAFDGTYRRK